MSDSEGEGDEAFLAISEVQDALEERDIVKLFEKLSDMDIPSLPSEDAQALFVHFVSYVSENHEGSHVGIKSLVEYWRKFVVPSSMHLGSETHFITNLFYDPSVEYSSLRLIFDSVDDLTSFDIINDIFLNPYEGDIPLALDRLEPFVSSLTFDDLQGIRDRGSKSDHEYIVEWFTLKMKEKAPVCERPDHLIQHGDHMPTQDELEATVTHLHNPEGVKIEDALKLVSKDFEGLDDFKHIEEMIKVELVSRGGIDRIESASRHETNAARMDDPLLLQIYGPSNVMVGTQLGTNFICHKLGGCRMLECNCFAENNNPEDIGCDEFELTDWFTGSCASCEGTILKRHHSLRIPRPHGGWIGTYCSWRCVHDGIDRIFKDEMGARHIPVGVCSLESPQNLETELAKKFEEEIAKTGIFDRE